MLPTTLSRIIDVIGAKTLVRWFSILMSPGRLPNQASQPSLARIPSTTRPPPTTIRVLPTRRPCSMIGFSFLCRTQFVSELAQRLPDCREERRRRVLDLVADLRVTHGIADRVDEGLCCGSDRRERLSHVFFGRTVVADDLAVSISEF